MNTQACNGFVIKIITEIGIREQLKYSGNKLNEHDLDEKTLVMIKNFEYRMFKKH